MSFNVREDLRHMIDHIANRIHYAESRISAFAVLGTAIFAAGVAIFSFAIGDSIKVVCLRYTSIALSLGLILTGLISWFVYARQTNYKYPFTQVTNTWKWFYRNVLDDHKKFRLSFNDYFYRTEESNNLGENEYNQQYNVFKSNIIPLFDDESKHNEQDFQQIFVLHVNECYKNVFLTNIRRVIHYGVFASVLISIITFSTSILITKDNPDISGSTIKNEKDSDVSVSWKSEGSRKYSTGEEETKINITILAKNKATKEKQFSSMSINSKNHTVILGALIDPPVKVKALTATTFKKEMWVKTSLLPEISEVCIYE